MNEFAARAVELAGRGFPMPNPHVGCVIVREGRVVGEGWHEAAGMAHAEAMALAQAGELARGAEAWVTLEPCAHQGRTPPCANALIESGIHRVWIGTEDPNPIAQGGKTRLSSAGILLARDAEFTRESERVNRVWLTAMRNERPYVTLKAALTLDLFMARKDRSSQWITSEAARARARRLRAEMGAVMVGSGTLRTDNPNLTVRDASIPCIPIRVALDTHRVLPSNLNVFDSQAPTLHMVLAENAHPGDLMLTGHSPREMLNALWSRGVHGLLVEGGPKLLSSFLASGRYDRLVLHFAPIAFGEGLAIEGLAHAVQGLQVVQTSLYDGTWEVIFEKESGQGTIES